MPRASGTGASFRTYQSLPRRPSFKLLTTRLIVALLLGGPLPVLAQGGLYGPEAPRDVSYVRVINASEGEEVTPAIGGLEWQPLGFAEVSSYRQLPPGEHSAAIRDFELTLTTQPESFTTLVLLEEELLAINDTPLRDISRGLLTLYNLTQEGPLSLRTADGTQVIAEVAPHSAASRAITQAQVELVVVAGEERLGAVDRRLYQRGEAHSVIVLPAGSDPRIVYVRAAAER